jgi:tRNA A-37 threonylcarbamoyl transferase component Bud32
MRRLVINGPLGLLLMMAIISTFVRWPTALLIVGLLRLVPAAVWGGRKAWQVRQIRRRTRALFQRVQSSYAQTTFTLLDQIPLEKRTRAAIESARQQVGGRELVIGRLDADGRVLGLFGPLPSLPTVAVSSFVLRPRMRVDIVVMDGQLLIRKDFRGDDVKFLREWQALGTLYGRANVPAVHHVDERRRRLYRNFIPGRTVSEIMVARGARISYLQTASDPELRRLDPASRMERIAARARPFLQACFPPDFKRQLEKQLDLMHEAGVTGVSPTFQNVVLDDAGRPWFIDFEDARVHAGRASLAFRLGRARDRLRLRRYGGEPEFDPLVPTMAWRGP